MGSRGIKLACHARYMLVIPYILIENAPPYKYNVRMYIIYILFPADTVYLDDKHIQYS